MTLRKLLICPWFGPLPSWFEHYEANAAELFSRGWTWLYLFDLDEFQERVTERLKIECPIQPGTGKIHDYRAAFGVLFADEIKGYDFWGHTDFDCVYGRLERFVPDELLADLDIYTDHNDYICGPLSLFRVGSGAEALFLVHRDWRAILTDPGTSGWVETSYTDIVNESSLRVRYQEQHVWQPHDLERLRWEGRQLMLNDEERSFAHFRRTKVYPQGLLA